MRTYLDIFFSWQTLLDIALIAAGLFFLYRTLLRLGTWKIVLGMLAAFLVYLLASLLNLEGIEWLFNNVSHVALIGLIIIFQPELRKIFEKLVSLAMGKSSSQISSTLTAISESLWLLAAQKRGAILVFPGKEQIRDKISGGFALDALPTTPLLMSIFDPNSPGHDGAVIVDENRLAFFGVRLPISSSSRLSEDFGTRHHAAMGMAEQTDALVLLVSEERGHVSAFIDGKMKRLNSKEEIIAEIENHSARLGIKQMAQKVYASKTTSLQIAGSLALAIIFWSTLILGQKQLIERTLTIPIEYTSPSKGLIFTGKRVNELIVHAAGPKSAVHDFALSEPRAVVDLTKMSAGTQSILVTGRNIRHPKDVTLLDINPAELELDLVAIEQKTIPIKPQLIGQLPEGLKLKSVEVIPSELRVFAPPASQGNRTESLSTTPVYLSSINASSRIVGKIIAPPSFQPVERPWPDIEVVITLE